VVKRIAAGGASDDEVSDVYAGLRDALRASDNAAFGLQLQRFGEIASGRGDTSRLWRQATDLIDRRARLVDLERKHALAESNVLTRTTAAALANALLESVVNHVRDRETLSAIAAEFRMLVDVRGLREEGQ
jgi:hypothetical protein